MDWLKTLWASWKVRVSLVGGVLVIATAYGTCEVDPGEVSSNTTETTEAAATETVKVSATTETTTEGTNEETTTSTTENSGETTTETETTTEQ